MQLLLALPLALSSTSANARPGATHDVVDDGTCMPDPERPGVVVCLSQELELLRIEDRRGRVRVLTWGTQRYEEHQDGELIFEHDGTVRSWELIVDGATEDVRYRGCTLIESDEGEWEAVRMRYVLVNGEVRLHQTELQPSCD